MSSAIKFAKSGTVVWHLRHTAHRSNQKVPSEIFYKTSKRNHPEDFTCGFEAQKDANRLKWFKLLLDPSYIDQISDLKITLEQKSSSKPKDKQAVEVARDYFSSLLSSLKSEISRRFGPSFYDVITKTFVFTVPAVSVV